MSQNMDEKRSRRQGAGINRSLSADYIWPQGFGETSVAPRNVSRVQADTHARKTCEETASLKSSKRSQVSVDVQRRKLNIETEKARQKLEQQQREIENRMRLLHMEHELREAEIMDGSSSRSTNSDIRSKLPVIGNNEDGNDARTQLWVENTQEALMHTRIAPVSEENRNFIEGIRQNEQQNDCERTVDHFDNLKNGASSVVKIVESAENNDIKLLCQTISNVIKSANPSDSKYEKFLARQIVDKDIPIFDGNPEDWPLFKEQFQRITQMCGYNQTEIMVKLRKCLRGEAKSAVSGMMIGNTDVKLIIDVLQMRFGRSDLIIESIISRIQKLSTIRDSNMEKLIMFSNEVQNLTATMKSLNSNGHLFNPQLLKDLSNKLPDSLRLRWGETVFKKNGSVTLEDFSSWLMEIANAACYVSLPGNFQSTLETAKNLRKPWSKRPDMVLNTREMKTRCDYCEREDHNVGNCMKFKSDDVDTRWTIVTGKKLCFLCLNGNHQKFRCKMKKPCGVEGCKFRHHHLLHKMNPSHNRPQEKPQENIPNSHNDDRNQSVLTVRQQEKNVLLRMIPVKLHGPNGIVETLALCDEASTVTLVEESVAENLGINGVAEDLCIQWTNNVVSKLENSRKVDMDISGAGVNCKKYRLEGVRTIKNLSLPEQTIDMNAWKTHSYLESLPIDSFFNERPLILIGQDNVELIVARQTFCSHEGGRLPIATKCKLGWSLHGPRYRYTDDKFVNHAQTLHICDKKHDSELHELVKQSFSTESFGVMPITKKYSQDEKRALAIMKTTAKRDGNRFEIGLLWKEDQMQLPESKSHAFQRLLCVERKCEKNPSFANAYCHKIDSYLEKGYLKKLTKEEAAINTPNTWYLPHFATINPNKPGKIRMVFDAAAKVNGISLNDCLLPGPDLLQPLTAVLLRFRQRKIGFCGDVREMFHQVKIRQEDRCAQRLLWRNLDYQRPPDTYEMQVMTFGASCSPSCAQYIKNLNAEENTSDPDVSTAITKRFYVDDYLDSKDTENEAIRIISEVRRIQLLGGFEVVNWLSNSSSVMKYFSEESIGIKDINDGSASTFRILGILWNPEDDNFQFTIRKYDDGKMTKRNVLKMTMSIYDPLGFLAHVTVGAKVILQEIWRAGVGWDDKLPPALDRTWKNWIPIAKETELHLFCDSSQKAFCSVAYLRVISHESIDVMLVMAKTRVAPLKPLSIPRLELQAAVMASRMAHTLKEELEIKISRTVFWSDSKCVLSWIRGDGRRYKQFVAHRIGEIQEITDIRDWHWVPSELNIADVATRMDSEKDISRIWFFGPNFLKEIEVKFREVTPLPVDDNTELLETPHNFIGNISGRVSCLPDIARFSKWLRLIRSTAWMKRFVGNMKKKIEKESIDRSTCLTVLEMQEAEKLWVKKVQSEDFGEEIAMLMKQKTVDKKSKLRQLCPQINEEGLLVLGGRLDLAKCLEDESKKPYIISPKNKYTTLLLQHFHEEFKHQGTETILNEVRRKYWIIDGRAAVKAAKRNCQRCKINESIPNPPKMGQLPLKRLSLSTRPFVNVGMDYFGPIFVTIGRRKEKRWGVLFTCLAVRAIHLEMAFSLSTDSAIMAIRRFISRRGYPKTITCDNGTNLKGAAEELRKSISELNDSIITDSMAIKNIQFSFIPPGAPHMGGAWERLIGTVKKALGTVIYGQSLREETLLTLFAETENIVNSRPLTHVSVDPDDLEALTPNHFLIGYAHSEGSPGDFESGKYLRKEWRKSQMLANSFWKRWIRDYLPSLNRRNKWTDSQELLKLGDVVLMVDENIPRNSWKIGRVSAVFPGTDGQVRVVDVKTAKNTYRRPVAKLCRIPVEAEVLGKEDCIPLPGGEC